MKGKNVLITGGLGFLGSNLAIKLVGQGAKVTIIDAMIPGLGGNDYNIVEMSRTTRQRRVECGILNSYQVVLEHVSEALASEHHQKPKVSETQNSTTPPTKCEWNSDIKNKVIVVKGDIRNEKLMAKLVQGKDFVFHLAGQVDHHRSMENPLEDLDIRCKGTLVLLEALRSSNRSCKLIFSSTRAVYGSPEKLPVSETAPTNPKGMYAVTSLAAEKMIIIYGSLYGIRNSILRITNGYGPRQQMKKPYGVANWFVRQVIDAKPIKIMGDGSNLRDFLYVDDISNALIAAALSEKANGEVFNVASGKGVSFFELAKAVISSYGGGSCEFVPYPEDTRKLEPGSFVADISKITKALGWKSKTNLEDGLRLTIQFYRKDKKHYW